MKKVVVAVAALFCFSVGMGVSMASDVPVHSLEQYWLLKGFAPAADATVKKVEARFVYSKDGRQGEKEIFKKSVLLKRENDPGITPSVTREPVKGWSVDYNVVETVALSFFFYNETFVTSTVKSTFVWLDDARAISVDGESYAMANGDVVVGSR